MVGEPGFIRSESDNWQRDVPGARWFKADLHIHTIDDHPGGGKAKRPAELAGHLNDPETLSKYAQLFLKALVAKGVQVAGLTPHDPFIDSELGVSAVWSVVKKWNEGCDEDGIPFREKIYAVFPGFEPSFLTGRAGLHMLFLFDPEMGQDLFRKAFTLVMNGIEPWKNRDLQPSAHDAQKAFEDLKDFWKRESSSSTGRGQSAWNYLVLAPHIDSKKGLLHELHGSVLKYFSPHAIIAGLELPDNKLPSDLLDHPKRREWLRSAMDQHNQAFFHSSDAYSLDKIGQRYTWIKLAKPRIEALRQAFIASDSRLRIAFTRKENQLVPLTRPQAPLAGQRPWLRGVTVKGPAAFFGGNGKSGPLETCFRLSPDLTCVIGGSMTGKSTFLDGLRIHSEASLPPEDVLKQQVDARGRKFLAGDATVELDIPGTDPGESVKRRWPAQFFTQNELQRLAIESSAVEEILARLVQSESEEIAKRNSELQELDEQLADEAKKLWKLDDNVADAEQAWEQACVAKRQLATFAEVGAEQLDQASQFRIAWEECRKSAEAFKKLISDASAEAVVFAVPQLDEQPGRQVDNKDVEVSINDLVQSWARLTDAVGKVNEDVNRWIDAALKLIADLITKEETLRVEINRALAEKGLDPAELRKFKSISARASLLGSYRMNRDEQISVRKESQRVFDSLLDQRQAVTNAQRQAFDRVSEQIRHTFGDQFRVVRKNNGDVRHLETFLRALKRKGVTQWWNGLDRDKRPSPGALVEALKSDSLSKFHMSDAVRKTFGEAMTRAKRLELAAVRCPDRYVLKLKMEDGTYRPLDELSGGQRVSVLLSLLLETADDRPLVIDQPEDELDSRFLFSTILPALKKVRGQRQIILATHNPNVVVNGDADMVIQLEANASHGRIACAGTIDEQAIRSAIVRTVDGGEDAFRLRRRKYGF